jgi:glycosyltransferase involved in cell wall biosynthesis
MWVCGSRVVGGAERVTAQVGALLRARGHTVEAIAPAGSPVHALFAGAGIRTRDAPLGRPRDARAIGAIARAVRASSADVALATTPHEWVWASLAPRRGTKLVLVRHMALPLPRPVRWLTRRRADAVVAVGETVRDALVGGGALPGGLVHVIPNPVRFTPREDVPSPDARAAARTALALPGTGRWVGFFGGLDRRKGIRDAVSAVEAANLAGAGTSLLVCGRAHDADLAGALREWSSVPALRDRIHHVGPIEDVRTAMTAMDVALIATRSDLREGLPLTALEAMACGTPVVGYATGGVVEAVGGSDGAGALATPDDPASLAERLRAVLGDPDLARRLARAGLARAREHHAPEAAVARYERLLGEVVARGEAAR